MAKLPTAIVQARESVTNSRGLRTQPDQPFERVAVSFAAALAVLMRGRSGPALLVDSRVRLGVLRPFDEGCPVSRSYDGGQVMGIDLHRRRSVIVRVDR